jgi:retinol dehydrogenase-12
MMLLKNAKVYIGARNTDKSKDALKRLKDETGKEAFLIPLDLSDLHQVRKAAEDFLR